MEIKEIKNLKKNLPRFFCEFCDFKCYMKCDWDRHLLRPKHLKHENGNNLATILDKKTYFCDCGKKYTTKSGLWKHNKFCCKINNSNDNDNENTNMTNKDDLINHLMKDNQELKNLVLEVLKNGFSNTNTNNINNINSNNKTFNLNVFLNETCKDAMNITDFIDSLKLQLSDLENVGEVGYIEGISNIIIKNLNALDITERPIHCTDKKRETMYIKDEDKWEKEDENKAKLHKLVRKVSNKNINLISEFQKMHPEYRKCSSRVSDQYNKIVIESMGGKGDNEYEKEEKIIKRVAKEVFVDKLNNKVSK
jgi:hypothetical protein